MTTISQASGSDAFDGVIAHGPKDAIWVSGEDGASWLQGLLTADVATGGHCAVRALALDRLGKIQAEFLVLRVERDYCLVLLGGKLHAVLAHFERLIVMEDVAVRPVHGHLWSFHGDSVESHLKALPASATRWLARLQWLTVGDAVCFSLENELSLLGEGAVSVGALSCGTANWASLRVAHGIGEFGIDYTSADNPGQAGLLATTVSTTKGCYLGQEVVCKLLMRGALREQTCRLWFDIAPSVGCEIVLVDNGLSVGTVTSVGSPGTLGVWALGRVRVSAIESRAAVRAGHSVGRIDPS